MELSGSDSGWYRTDSGGAIVIGEPYSASSWYPVNEHPADTATFAVTATVPQEWQVISNGIRQTDGLPDPDAGNAVFRWALSDPVASYLTTLYIDKFDVVEGKLADGKPIVSAIAPDANNDARELAESTGQIIDVLSGYFGPYPFEAAGGIFTGAEHRVRAGDRHPAGLRRRADRQLRDRRARTRPPVVRR